MPPATARSPFNLEIERRDPEFVLQMNELQQEHAGSNIGKLLIVFLDGSTFSGQGDDWIEAIKRSSFFTDSRDQVGIRKEYKKKRNKTPTGMESYPGEWQLHLEQ